MMKTRIAIAALVAAGLAGSTFTADAMSSKHKTKHHSSMTTGANMKSDKGAANPSSQGSSSTNKPATGGK